MKINFDDLNLASKKRTVSSLYNNKYIAHLGPLVVSFGNPILTTDSKIKIINTFILNLLNKAKA